MVSESEVEVEEVCEGEIEIGDADVAVDEPEQVVG